MQFENVEQKDQFEEFIKSLIGQRLGGLVIAFINLFRGKR